MKKTFHELLIELGACDDAIEWAGERTIEQVVNDCDRGEWLAWLAEKIELDKRSLALVGGHIANTVRHLMTDERSVRSVDVCIAYGEGRATPHRLRDAGAGADDAHVGAAAVLAWAAAKAEAAGAWATEEAAGAWATEEAAWAWAWAAAEAAEAANRKQTADICRKHIGQQIIEKVNQMLK